MVFSNDLIKHIMEDYLFDNDIYQDGKFQCGFFELVEGITIELNAIADTERRLQDITAEERMLTEEHEKACDELLASKIEVMENCRHHSITTTYYSEASGKDSLTTCDACGKEV